jgi:hypothetical protein
VGAAEAMATEALEEGRKTEDGGWRREEGGGLMKERGMKTLEGGHKNEERGTGRASGAFPIRV